LNFLELIYSEVCFFFTQRRPQAVGGQRRL
jgi:hypothetical protein